MLVHIVNYCSRCFIKPQANISASLDHTYVVRTPVMDGLFSTQRSMGIGQHIPIRFYEFEDKSATTNMALLPLFNKDVERLINMSLTH